MNPSRVVIDSNVFFAALLRRQSVLRERLLEPGETRFLSPRFVVVELFKHKERIVTETELSEDEVLECLNAVLSRVTLVEEGVIPVGTWMEARRLCAGVDLKDSPFVALTLHVDGRLWTRDAELEAGMRAKGFTHFYSP